MIYFQSVRRGYNARKQVKVIRDEFATNGSKQPSKEIKKSTALVVCGSSVSKTRAPTRAVAPVIKFSVQKEWHTDWKEDTGFYTVFLLFVFGVLFWSIPVSPAQCTLDTFQNTTDCWVV